MAERDAARVMYRALPSAHSQLIREFAVIPHRVEGGVVHHREKQSSNVDKVTVETTTGQVEQTVHVGKACTSAATQQQATAATTRVSELWADVVMKHRYE
jgi:hypothetical protein